MRVGDMTLAQCSPTAVMPVERVLPSLEDVEEWPSGWAHTSLQAVITVEFTRAIRIHSALELSTTRPVTSA